MSALCPVCKHAIYYKEIDGITFFCTNCLWNEKGVFEKFVK